jgi:hypothetical protein
MNSAVLDLVISCQEALLDALDARDVCAIESVSAALAKALAEARNADSWSDSGTLRQKVDHASKQATAARIRVNCLSQWTRQRIDRLNELRGAKLCDSYEDYRKSAKI